MSVKKTYEEVQAPGDGWEYKREGDNYLTRRTGNEKWINAKGNAREAIQAKIYKEPDAISRRKAGQPLSSSVKAKTSSRNEII